MKNSAPTAAKLAVLYGLGGVAALLALEAGSAAYTKRVETTLLAEPRPLAAAAGKLAIGRKVKVEEVKGNWLRVSDGPTAGWVFAGNLSETKLTEAKGLDVVNLAAGKTTATAADRGLRPISGNTKEYATGRNLNTAYQDLNWLMEQCRAYTPEEVEAFLQKQKKGEYQ